MNKTIAQQLNVTKFPFSIKDDSGKEIYYETSDGLWYKQEYDSNGNIIYHQDNRGYWSKQKYDNKGNKTYYENSGGYWRKSEYDSKGNEIYWENSNGRIIDNRSKAVPEYAMEQLIAKVGHDFKIKK